jgi:hypothetical protein
MEVDGEEESVGNSSGRNGGKMYSETKLFQ